ncbi:MAG TPA: acyl-CoA acyltransferase [Hyphomicrobiales bacterium]|nr:acyl-CoA acyltransferase [Hyphomicrobiales bacterium]
MAALVQQQASIRCRPIGDDDLPAVADLLFRGFPGRAKRYWQEGLDRQRRAALPPGRPRYGYLLANGEEPVGALLVLFAADDRGQVRCNLSSWYVEPAYRAFAPLLLNVAAKHREVTYLNVSPARHTWATIEAQGFVRYSAGQFVALPLLARADEACAVETVGADDAPIEPCPERHLLARHAGFGCLSVVVAAEDGHHPFVFRRARVRRGRIPLPAAQLLYCRSVAELVRFARPLGRHLAWRGMPFLILDADGSVAGLAGFHVADWRRKYFRGPVPPRLGDLADTELALYGP